MKLITISIFIILVGFTACSSKTNTARKPVTNILITPSNKTVVYGNDFTIDVQSRITKPEITEIELYINNILIEKSTFHQFTQTLNSLQFLPGQYSIRTVAKNSKGAIGTNFNTFSIVSDIQPEQLSYRVVEHLAHNTKNYTQGLEFYQGKLYEGTGNHGESYVYCYDPKTGKEFKQLKLDDQYFGEGITILNNRLYQLTYKAKKGFVYDVNTFEKIEEFTFLSKEGWGLTNDGEYLIMSDGSSKVTYINPNTYKVEKTIEVSHPGGFVGSINELEYVDGVIYANVWPGETIVKFESNTGRVLAFIDMRGLLSNFNVGHIDVLNGIAYEPNEKLFYVTGKWWPRMFKVKFGLPTEF